MRVLAVVATALALTAPLTAQETGDAEPRDRNARHGFWIGAGLGPGSEQARCTGCSSSARANGPAGYLRLGGTLTHNLLLGGQLSAWSVTALGVEQGVGIGTIDLYWYPSASAPLYLKVGIGGLTYSGESSTTKVEETAPVVGVGAGYELRVLRNLSVVPFINAFGSSPVKRKINDVEVNTGGDIRRDMVQAGIGITLH